MVTVITGACGGIGRACAKLLSSKRDRIVLVDVDQNALDDTCAELSRTGGDGADILALRLSVTSEPDMERMVTETLTRFGRVDALIAAAGILRAGRQLRTVAETPFEEWEAVIETNLTGTFLSNRAVLRPMIEQKSGDIVNISSTSGRQGRPFDGAYCASKFGIIGLSESIAEEVSRHGIRVQTVLPDAVETPLWDQNPPAALKPIDMLPAARVAEFIHYLLTLPRDTYLMNPVIAPFKSRKKRRPAAPPETAQVDGPERR